MANVEQYKDITAFHPGYYISEIIQCMEMSHRKFADELGINLQLLEMILDGQASVSKVLAKSLSDLTGICEDVWLSLQEEYELVSAEIQRKQMHDRFYKK